MKTIKYFAVLLILSIICSVTAQVNDVVFRKNGTKTMCKISEVYPEMVKYRKANNPTGPVYTTMTKEISFIFYENGSYDIFPSSEKAVDKTRFYPKPDRDIIFTTDNRLFTGKVLKVDDEAVKFKVYENLNGPTYTRKLDHIVAIVFSSGQSQVFEVDEKAIKVLREQRPNFIQLLESQSTQQLAAVATTGENTNTFTELAAKKSSTNDVAAKYLGKTANSPSPIAKEEKINLLNSGPLGSGAAIEAKIKESTKEIDLDVFETRAQEKVEDLSVYLSIIASKMTDPSDANNAIDLAVELFTSPEAKVAVSSNRTKTIRKFPIPTYLNRLKLLKYDRVEIDWADINYVSDFRKGQDGNYYGTVSLKQTFKGYIDNTIAYTDVTEKEIEIVVKGIEKRINGVSERTWDVLLSDIGVKNVDFE